MHRLSDFNRYHFFLESKGTYHLLGYRDYKTLEWLQIQSHYGQNEEDFRRHILLRLEENYKVNRNNLFNKNLIDTIPQCQLMISELSGSFLMFSPAMDLRWCFN